MSEERICPIMSRSLYDENTERVIFGSISCKEKFCAAWGRVEGQMNEIEMGCRLIR